MGYALQNDNKKSLSRTGVNLLYTFCDQGFSALHVRLQQIQFDDFRQTA